MNDTERLKKKADRIISGIYASAKAEAKQATREVVEIEKTDWQHIIERIRRVEERLARLSHSPIGQEERK